MRVRYTGEANRDLGGIARFYFPKDPVVASKIRAAIQSAIRIITEFPLSGRRQDIVGVRKSVTKPYGYLIFYEIDDTNNEIIILGIKHPKPERPYEDG